MVICLRWVVVLSVLGVVVTIRVEVCMVHLQSGFVLSLFYLCAIQMNPVCVVCVVPSDRGLLLLYLFVTEVTTQYD